MVYLRVIKANTEETCNQKNENSIIIYRGETLLQGFEKVKIQKSNGEWHTFNIIRSDSVYRGDMSMSVVVRHTYRLHLNHTYWVEGYQCLTTLQCVNFDVSNIGIIGQDEAIRKIMWSVFEPRQFSAEILRKLNVTLPRGIVLYGPPGTGKTSLIRGICTYMHIQPQVVNGPELLQKYIGDSERAIRELFDEALYDQCEFGDASPLHVIVIDEMEALFPQRSSSSGETNTRNTVVSQMLTMMDGYTQLNNFVVFGTTNRLDMIDSALLRSGRFDRKIKIDLPGVKERFEILKFYSDHLKKSASLATDVTEAMLTMIAASTVDYSGANLKELVDNATLLAMQRVLMASKMDKNDKRTVDDSKIMVNLNDIISAYQTIEQERRMAQRENNTK